MRRVVLALAVLAVLGGAIPGGAPAHAAGALAFPAVDRNHDGFVTWEEASAKMLRLKRVHFEKCDLNGDGRIGEDEYPLLSTFYWANYVMPD